MIDNVTTTTRVPTASTAASATSAATTGSGFSDALAAAANATPANASAPAATSAAATAAWTPPWLTQPTGEGANLLLPMSDVRAINAQGGRDPAAPNLLEFMTKTGADSQTASELLYGVVSGKQDVRNWKTILASPDPLGAARRATGAMLNSPDHVAFNRTLQARNGDSGTNPADIVAQAGNFMVVKGDDGYALKIADGPGQAGRDLGWNAASIMDKARNYGLDTSKLADLADQLDAKGIGYKPYELYPGTGSNAGVDLRDLAKGGLGAADDWTKPDPMIADKGALAAEQATRNAAMASEIGLTATASVTTGKGVDINRISPQTTSDGVRNMVAVNGGSAVWFSTLAAADAYAAKTSGVVLNAQTRELSQSSANGGSASSGYLQFANALKTASQATGSAASIQDLVNEAFAKSGL